LVCSAALAIVATMVDCGSASSVLPRKRAVPPNLSDRRNSQRLTPISTTSVTAIPIKIQLEELEAWLPAAAAGVVNSKTGINHNKSGHRILPPSKDILL
jgi:hypothetical protein